MTHTLTIVNCLLMCLLVAVSCFFYYAMDNQDISITYTPKQNALYSLDPETKTLKRIEFAQASVSPVQLLIEEKLTTYLINRNQVTWDLEYMTAVFAPGSLLQQMTHQKLYEPLVATSKKQVQELRSKGLIRDIHLYELKLVREDLWVAIFDLFNIPLNNNLQSFCPCQDNSKECLACKKREAKSVMRFKVWMRVDQKNTKTLQNPLGIRVNSYTAQYLPIHENEYFWGLPPILRPDI